MAHKKRQKLDRTSTAAYAASQPVFDAIKKATDSIAEQSAHLTKAREISQSIHAKVVNGDHERHEEYMDSAVRAWKCATDSYCNIFEQLVSITAAEPSEGREAGKRHQEFAALLKTAERAKSTVEEFESSKKADSEDDEDEDEDEAPEEVKIKKEPVSDDEDEDEDVVEPANVPNGSGKRPMTATTSANEPALNANKSILNAKIRHDKHGRILWEDGELKVPADTLTPDERKAWSIIQERKRRKQRRGKAGPRKQQTKDDGKTTESMEEAGEKEPVVEYEDISAQVEERIKAKEEKRNAEKAAKKAEKKRKRESGDSFAGAGTEDAVPDPVDQGDEKPEKPAKKKSKQARSVEAEDIQPTVNGAQAAKEGKKQKSKKVDKGKENESEIVDDSAKELKKEKTKKVEKRKDAEEEDSKPTKKRKKVKGF